MILKLALTFFVLFTAYTVWSYLRERKYRKKPFYGLADIGWRTIQPPPTESRIHSVALVGDIGNAGPVETDSVMQSIKDWLDTEGAKSTIVFLGDNIYPVGLPPEGHRHHQNALQKLYYQLELFKSYEGKVVYLGGNHDWNKGRRNGLTYALRQERTICEALNDPLAFLPKNATLGPVPLEINDHLLLIVINTQWWVQKGEKPRRLYPDQEETNPEAFFSALQLLLEKNKHRFVIIAAHHPLYSNALHGGKFTVKQQLFPLTFINKKAMLPLPMAGLAFRLYRKYIGATEDMSFPPFKRFRKKILKLLHQYSNFFYVGGHDHNLQYFQVKGGHYAVSGSGSKTNFVAKGGKATFSHENKGFMVLDHYQDGSVWLRVLEPSEETPKKTIIAFQKCLYKT
ncbi:metallophosphoesterase [Rufibacter roseus]|uniref:Metallophosphoesterase n=1 Tax=Rufibacter roseus TaxID=1567108 RepID=A0ABW2DTL1_9BACT|nr:metallophosphoesterase [Rufibacter roseus]